MKKSSILLLITINLIICSCNNNNQDSINISNHIYQWKIATAWDKDLPILSDAVKNMAKDIELMSEGRMLIEIYAAGQATDKYGEKIETSKLWKAVSENEIQIMHSASYYWADDIPGSVFFCALPFGMSYDEMNAWFTNSNGLELWRDLYDDYNLIPFPCGGSGKQMGGWFNKKINTIGDFKNLKMRIGGIGGKVIEKAGATSVGVEQRKIKEYLEKGRVDAAEWIGPYHDYYMKLDEVARYYYEPGWQEPNNMFELTVNKQAFESLPQNLQEIITTISYKYNSIIYISFVDKNNEYRKILEEKNIQFMKFPKAILDTFENYSKIIIQDYISIDANHKSDRIYQSYLKYQTDKTIIKCDSVFNPKHSISTKNDTNIETSWWDWWNWDNRDDRWGAIGIAIAMFTVLITALFQIQKQRRFKKMLLRANCLLKDYFEGKETSEKIVDLRATIGHFLENHSIKEIQYNVLSNKITEIQSIIESKSTITEELKEEIEEIIADNIITEKEYQHLIHLIKSTKLKL